MSNGHPIFVVRSTGIEDIRRYEKSLENQGFFATERQRGRQNYKKIAMASGRYKYSSVSLKSPFVKTIGLLIAFLYFWVK